MIYASFAHIFKSNPYRHPAGAPNSQGGEFTSNPSSNGQTPLLTRREKLAQVKQAIKEAGGLFERMDLPLAVRQKLGKNYSHIATTIIKGGPYSGKVGFTLGEFNTPEFVSSLQTSLKKRGMQAFKVFQDEKSDGYYVSKVKG